MNLCTEREEEERSPNFVHWWANIRPEVASLSGEGGASDAKLANNFTNPNTQWYRNLEGEQRNLFQLFVSIKRVEAKRKLAPCTAVRMELWI